MNDWFTIDIIDDTTFCISEYRHPEQTHCYLLLGSERCLLIDTGLGIGNIYAQVRTLTDLPVTAVATHIHWDHIGGLGYFADLYVHKEEVSWLNGNFPLSLPFVRQMVGQCDLPAGFDLCHYTVFQGQPSTILVGGETIDLGNRQIQVIHTPGHSPGHLCFWEEQRGYLFTGDLVYKGTLYADYPSTDPDSYLRSLEKIATLPAQKVFPAHHSLDIAPTIIQHMVSALRDLKAHGNLHHGAGTFDYGDWAIKL